MKRSVCENCFRSIQGDLESLSEVRRSAIDEKEWEPTSRIDPKPHVNKRNLKGAVIQVGGPDVKYPDYYEYSDELWNSSALHGEKEIWYPTPAGFVNRYGFQKRIAANNIKTGPGMKTSRLDK